MFSDSARAGEVLGDPPGVLLAVGGVDHDEVGLVGALVDDEVIHHAAALIAHEAVPGAAGLEVGVVVGQQAVEIGQGVLAPEDQLAHVGHVEESAGRAHRHVLGDHAAVLDRQEPARKGDDFTACRHVTVVKWGFSLHDHDLL